MRFRTLDDCDVTAKIVLLRVDFNVPIMDGRITDTTRIERVKPTIEELVHRGAKLVLLSHFGRPNGAYVAKDSLRQIVASLEQLLGYPVRFVEDSIGFKVELAISQMENGSILLLENTRFYPGEEQNDLEFARALAAYGDLYVNDAFSASHRAHASTEALARILPSYAGRALQAELVALEQGLGKPERPVAALVGGAKVSSKIDLLTHLVGKVDSLVIGGAMANTFLLAQGFSVGKSLCEPELVEVARNVLASASHANCAIFLPIDVVVAENFSENSPHHSYSIEAVPADGMILDVGDRSLERIAAVIDDARTLLWNGPLGAFELYPFDRGTIYAAQQVAKRSREGKLVSIAGGGDTVAALNHAKAAEDFTYLSTAGGAFLEWMEGKVLPSIAVLEISAEKD